MKIVLYSVIFILFCLSTNSQEWKWADKYGGPDDEKARDLVIDQSGNIFISGIFSSSSFNIGTYKFASKGQSDIYLAKMDPGKKVLWAIQIGGVGDEEFFYFKIDKNGNIFGFLQYSKSFSIGSTKFPNQGDYDMAVIKFDPNGKLIWRKTFGGSLAEEVYCMALDQNANIYLGGRFLSSSISIDKTNLKRKGGADAFVFKLDSNGKALWAHNYGNLNEERIIRMDVEGNHLFIGGWMRSPQITIGTKTIYNSQKNDTKDIIIAKMDLNGNVKWASSIGSTNEDMLYSLDASNDGYLYIGGQYKSPTIKFGSSTLTNKGNFDLWVAKLNSSGTPVWAKSYGNTGIERAEDLKIIGNNIFILGHTGSSKITFDNNTFNTKGGKDGFLLKLNTSGKLLDQQIFGGIYDEHPRRLGGNSTQSIFVLGQFMSNSLYFGTHKLTNAGSNDAFLAEYSETQLFSVAGKVFENDFVVDFATVYLYNAGNKILIDSTSTDNGGYYKFEDIAQGSYKIKAALTKKSTNYGVYYPTYYGNKVDWDSASVLKITNEISNADIKLSKIMSSLLASNPKYIKAYPNPNSGILHIETRDFISERINIYNSFGQLIYSVHNSEPLFNMVSIDLSSYKTGTYILEIIDTENKTYMSIISKL